MTGTRKTRLLVAIIAGLQAGDVVTTNIALSIPGTIEANPLIAYLQSQLGSLWWLYKLPVTALLAGLFLWWGRPRPAMIAAALWLLIVATNLVSIFY